MSGDKYCLGYFELLVQEDPEQLLSLIQSNELPPSKLTFAAEYAGKIKTDAAIKVLLGLLKHRSPLVREGAIYGLIESGSKESNILDALLYHTENKNEKSPGVRIAAAEALEELSNES